MLLISYKSLLEQFEGESCVIIASEFNIRMVLLMVMVRVYKPRYNVQNVGLYHVLCIYS